VSTKKLAAAAKSDAAKYHVPLQDAPGEMASTGELKALLRFALTLPVLISFQEG